MDTEFVPCLHFNVLKHKGMSTERRQGDTKITTTDPKSAVSFVPVVSIRRVSLVKSTSYTLREGAIVSFCVSIDTNGQPHTWRG